MLYERYYSLNREKKKKKTFKNTLKVIDYFEKKKKKKVDYKSKSKYRCIGIDMCSDRYTPANNGSGAFLRYMIGLYVLSTTTTYKKKKK